MAKKESKLESIYDWIEGSEKIGISLTVDQLKEIAKREEQYIKEEVLPLLRDSIAPVLRKIKRELTLVVGYRPNESISLRISHEPDLADLESAVSLTPDDIPEYHKRSKQQRSGKRKPANELRVTMPDGTVIYNPKNATDTFCNVLQQIGLIKVRGLEIMLSGINIVSTSKDPNRQQRKIGDFYIFTNSSTTKKAELLREIVSRLNLSIDIEVPNS